MTHQTDDHRAAAADIAFRRRALRVNAAIYARRHGHHLMPLLEGLVPLRTRFVAVTDWMETERDWRPEDARRLSPLADEIHALGRRRVEVAEIGEWHADRLRELVRQHDVLARLEARLRPVPARPMSPAQKRSLAPGTSRRRRA
jgi:hypothetical protein